MDSKVWIKVIANNSLEYKYWNINWNNAKFMINSKDDRWKMKPIRISIRLLKR